MAVDPEAIGLVVLPLTIIDVAVNVLKTALTAGFIVLPLTDVVGPVRPSLRALSVSDQTKPLTVVNCSALVLVFGPLFPDLGVHGCMRHCRGLHKLSKREVLGRSDLLLFHIGVVAARLIASGPRLHFDD